MGFPEDLSIPLPGEEEAIVNLASRCSEILDPTKESQFLGSAFQQDFHFLMKFHNANKGKEAPGFSGGGIWCSIRQPDLSQIWRPNPGLVGIQSSWFPKRSITFAVKVELLVQFLAETLG